MNRPLPLLVFCDDTFHPAATVRSGLGDLETSGLIAPVWRENVTGWNSGELKNYPVVLLSKSNVVSSSDKTPWLKDGTEYAFRDYVRSGGGLVVVHSGTASYAQVAPMRELTGGTFLNHPPPCEVIVEPRPHHLLTAGVDEAFSIHDEHYVMALDDLAADVFLHTRSQHGTQPAGWTRTEGKGRVCVLTPGHFADVWRHPSFQILLSNAVSWVTPLSRGE